MIATDTSTMVDWLRHGPIARPDVAALLQALKDERLVLPPPVITELLSYPEMDNRTKRMLSGFRQLPLVEGFWERAGAARARLRRLGLKAKLPDALIAQCCIDAGVPLISQDADFRHFAAHCGLKLLA